MNYEEKYNEALERARDLMTKQNPPAFNKDLISLVFPELKESEDERIRKELIEQVAYIIPNNDEVDSEGDALPTYQKRIDKYRAWLEKQGETFTKKDIDDAYLKGVCDAKHELEKQGEQTTDKVEPKFKVGDWIVQEKIGVYKVIEICESWYIVADNKGNHYSIDFDKEYMCHLWTINDAKDGDVLVDSYSKDSIIILYKGIYKERSILAHCGWNGYNFSIKTNGLGYGGLDNTNYLPATKEQRDLLFAKMKDAGYIWDAEKKELKEIEL